MGFYDVYLSKQKDEPIKITEKNGKHIPCTSIEMSVDKGVGVVHMKVIGKYELLTPEHHQEIIDRYEEKING